MEPECAGETPVVTAPEWPEGRFTSVAAGTKHMCVLREDGAAVCWGNAFYGQTSVPEGERFQFISSGARHVCGLREDRSVTCWGENSFGKAPALSPKVSPVADAPNAGDILGAAAATMDSIEWYHFESDLMYLIVANNGVFAWSQLKFDGDFVALDQWRATMKMPEGIEGDFLKPPPDNPYSKEGVKIIHVGDTQYHLDPQSDEWQSRDVDRFDLMGMLNVPIDTSAVTHVSLDGRAILDGVEVYVLSGTTASGPISYSKSSGRDPTFHFRYWIGVEDSMIRRMTVEHETAPDVPAPPYRVNTNLTDFGKQFKIEAPK